MPFLYLRSYINVTFPETKNKQCPNVSDPQEFSMVNPYCEEPTNCRLPEERPTVPTFALHVEPECFMHQQFTPFRSVRISLQGYFWLIFLIENEESNTDSTGPLLLLYACQII